MRTFAIHTEGLTYSIGEIADMCDVLDTAPEDLDRLVRDEHAGGGRRLRALAAIAWIVSRRDEPGLTYADVLDGSVQIIGEVAEGTVDPSAPPPRPQLAAVGSS